MFSCICPHAGEEMWAKLGHTDTIAYENWPQYDEAKTIEDTVEIAVQINGKIKATLAISRDAEKDAVIAQAKEVAGDMLNITVHKIKNNFFGGNVWVTGLITATDIIDQLQGKLTSDRLLLCNDMLRSEQDMFLDNKTPADIEAALGVKTEFYSNDGLQMAQTLLGTEY